MKKIMFIFAVVFAMIGCSERNETVSMEKDYSSTSDEVLYQTDGEPGVAVSFEFTYGRKSKNCHKFGICELTAFGIGIIEMPDKPEQPKADVIAQEDGTFKGVHKLSAPMVFEDGDDVLYIDEDLKGTDEFGSTYVIKAGEYLYNETIGAYGGYEFDVVKI